jgi:hypothetical protein
MKITKFVLVFLFLSCFISCSSDDSNGTDNGDNTDDFVLTMNDGSFWTYNIESQDNNTRDSIYISNDTMINGRTYKKFKVENDIATGFYSSSLRNNGVRFLDGKLLLSGDLSLAGGADLGLDFDVTLVDFVIFNRNASSGQLLSTKFGIIEEDFDGTPVTINYSLKSFGGETFNAFSSPNGDSYENVKSVAIILNISVTTVQEIFGFPVVITVLAPQDVIVSTQYIASGIGVVHTNTDTSYSINTTIADQFGIPATGSQNQKEYLDEYQIN